MDLYLIRHGQSQNNARPERLREEDPSLTEDGRRQADHLAEWIHHLRLTRIITSPFLRTLETTAHLCRRLALIPEVRVDLHEFGGCVAGARLRELTGRPGMTRSQLEDRYPGIKVPAAIDEQGWWKCKPYETDRLARRRAARLLRRTREEFGHSGERVAYVTHADIEVLFLEQFHDGPLECPWNTSVSRIEISPDDTRLADYNLVEHLPAALMTRYHPETRLKSSISGASGSWYKVVAPKLDSGAPLAS